MGQIYCQAHQIVAWLGDSAPTLSTAMKLLRLLAKLDVEIIEGGIEVSESNTSALFLELMEDMAINSLKELFDLNNPVWQGLIALVERPWFSRLCSPRGCLVQGSSISLWWFHHLRKYVLQSYPGNIAHKDVAN
jgi:hypothetical protein